MWPAIRITYEWAHRVARLLANEDALTGREVRQRMDDLLAEIRGDRATVGALQPAVAPFLKVSASYRPGLFYCYDVPGVPRTNNGLEQYFGSTRYHQRRANGRIHATAATVVRGSVRVLASTASRLHRFGEYECATPISGGGGIYALPLNCARRHVANRAAPARTRQPTSPRGKPDYSSRVCHPSTTLASRHSKGGRLGWTSHSGG